MKTTPLAALLSLSLALGASAQSSRDLVETARRAGSFSTLLTAVDAAGLTDALRGEGPLTVFAPSDEAFADLPEGVLDVLLQPSNRTALGAVLAYHVVPGRLSAQDAVVAGRLETLESSPLSVAISDGRVTVGGAVVVSTDVAASNGVIHVIDRVLLPPSLQLDQPRGLERIMALAIERGAPLFNAGQHAGCAAVYEIATRAMLELGGDAVAGPARRRLERGLRDAMEAPDATGRAWALRYAFDDVLEMGAAMMSTGETTDTSTLGGRDERVLFEFRNPGGEPGWFTLNDDVMGGISRSGVRIENGVAVFSGSLSLENNGGFATIRSRETDLALGGWEGLRLRVRGDGRTYGVSALGGDERGRVRTWRKTFDTRAGEWMELEVPFDDLVLSVMGRRYPQAGPVDPADLRSISFIISDKDESPFRLEVDSIRAYR